jgi:hypothetical protein
MFDFEDLNSGEPIEDVKFDIDVIRSKIPTHSSKKLCEMIVTARYFGLHSDLDVYCMEELASRRLNGDTFDFESYIDESTKELPVLDFSAGGFDIRQVLSQAMSIK